MNLRRTPIGLLVLAALMASAAGLAVPRASSAQVVEGIVFEPSALRPISGVELQLLGPDDRRVASEVSDAYGRFRLAAPAAGSWRVAAALIGYGTARSDLIELEAGQTVSIEIRMSVDPVEIEQDVVVLGDAAIMSGEIEQFHRRRRLGEKTGLGHYIYGADLERVSGRPSGLLRTVPGVSLARGAAGRGQVIQMRGGCIPAIYIDGAHINAFNRAESLDIYLDIGSIEGIEVYRGSQQAGGRFHDQNGCGLVLVWTHRGQYDTDGTFGWKRVAIVLGILVAIFALR